MNSLNQLTVRLLGDVIGLFEQHKWVVTPCKSYKGSAWIFARNEHDTIRLKYDPVSGQFFGDHVTGISFDHLSSELAERDWYQQIINIIFITEKETTV